MQISFWVKNPLNFLGTNILVISCQLFENKGLQQEDRVYVGEWVGKEEDGKESCWENHSPLSPHTAKFSSSEVISGRRYLL